MAAGGRIKPTFFNDLREGSALSRVIRTMP